MKIIFDSEWRVQEGKHVVHDAEAMHCIVCKDIDTGGWAEFYEESLELFPEYIMGANTIIAHNLVGADLHVFKKLLGIEFTVSPRTTIMSKECKFIDTLSWSRRLYPDRKIGHGLGPWGQYLGIAKPEIEDWSEQPIETYLHRCREDVKINEAVYYRLLEEMK